MEIIVYFKVFEIQYFLHMLRIGLKMEYFYTLAPLKMRDSHVSGTYFFTSRYRFILFNEINAGIEKKSAKFEHCSYGSSPHKLHQEALQSE